MKNYLRLASSVPDGEKPPGIHPNWPMTRFVVPDEVGPPEEDLIGPLTDEEVDEYIESEREAFEAANAANAAAQQAWYEAPQIPYAKEQRYKEIDARTDAIIEQGFTHSSKVFSLSLSAQMKLLGTFAARDGLEYPVIWNTLDDSNTHSIANAAEVVTMYGLAVSAIRSALDSGTELKDSVRAATTLAEIAAVVDSR